VPRLFSAGFRAKVQRSFRDIVNAGQALVKKPAVAGLSLGRIEDAPGFAARVAAATVTRAGADPP
jgi:hypothetical protein